MPTSVTAFIAELPPEQRELTQFVHEFVLREVPEATAAIKWAVPFYSRRQNLLFLNPKPEHLIVGFYKGASLPNRSGALVGTGKQVRHFLLPWSAKVPLDTLRELLAEAVAADGV